jgi:hypothetical protein
MRSTYYGVLYPELWLSQRRIGSSYSGVRRPRMAATIQSIFPSIVVKAIQITGTGKTGTYLLRSFGPRIYSPF